MAKTVVTTDDLDGSADAEPVTFSYGGVDYTIDLAKKSRAALEKALKPFIDAATVTSRNPGSRRRSSGSRSSGSRSRARSVRDTAQVRAWAHEQGIEVSDRGRIAAAVVDAYDAAH